MRGSPHRLLLCCGLLALSQGCTKPEDPAQVEIPKIVTEEMEPQVAEKIEFAHQAVEERRYSASAWGEMGMTLQAHELFPEAVVCYLEAERLASADHRWPYLTALALERDRPTEAVDAYARAAALRPEHASFYVHQGDALVAMDRKAEAKVAFRRALELDPRSSHALYGLARVAVAANDLTAARGYLEEAAEIAPRHGQVHVLLAQVYFRLDEKDKAQREELLAAAYPDPSQPYDPVVEALKLKAVNSRSYTQRGLRLVDEGRFVEAEEAFREVLRIRPGNARDFANLGGALARQGKLDDAIENYQQALTIAPDDPWTLNNLALALADQGDFEGAVAYLEEALAIDATYAEAHANLGLVRSRQGRLDEAIAAYREALRLDAAVVDVHTNLGTALAARGQIAQAMEHWRKALEIDRRDLSALYNLSVALSQSGDHGQAIGLLREGLVYAPNASRLTSLLAWELASAPTPDLRDGEEAVRLARRIYSAYPDRASSADLLAMALAETGKFEEAQRLGLRALNLAQQESSSPAFLQQLQIRLDGYRQGQAFNLPQASQS